VITNIHGFGLFVALLLGHNNDQGSFNITKRQQVEGDNILLLVDRAYHSKNVIRPDAVLDEGWSTIHAAHRSPGEIINSESKTFIFAHARVKQNPETHAMGLMAIYNLINILLKNNPSRLRFISTERINTMI